MPPPWSVESSDRSRSPSLTVPRPRLWRIAGDGCEGRSLACRSRALPGSDTVPVIVPVIALATSRVAVERAPAVIRPTSLSILPELSREDPARFLRSGEIGRAHVCTTVTNAHLVCRLLIENKTTKTVHTHNIYLQQHKLI